MKIKEYLKNYLKTKSIKSLQAYLNNLKDTTIKDIIIKETSFLKHQKITITERIYCILNDISSQPLCDHCKQKYVNFINFTHGYRPVCSIKCSANSIERKEKIKQTCIKKYGVDNPYKSLKIREQIKEKIKSKYGSEHYFQTDDYKEKYKKTCLKKYGYESHNKSEIIKERKTASMLKKYNYENPLQIPEVQEKIKQTCIEKYGYENVSQVPEVKEKIKETIIERYGKAYWYLCPSLGKNETQILDEIEETEGINIERQYNVLSYFLDGYCKETNTAYEVDESYHFTEEQQKKDLMRQQEIKAHLGCKFIRIKDN